MKPPVMPGTEPTPPRREKNDEQLAHEEKVFGVQGDEESEWTVSNPSKESASYQPAEGEVLSLFTTPMLRGDMARDKLDEIAVDCRLMVDEVKEIVGENPHTEYTSYFHEDIRTSMHDKEWFKTFSDTIKDSYITFCLNMFNHPVKHLCRDDIHLFAWVNVYTGQHQHAAHNHVNSIMSGTWYIKTDNSDQPIKFLNPNYTTLAGHLAHDRPYQREEHPDMIYDGVQGADSSVQFIPREGQFLLWPSYLIHSVEPVQQPPHEGYERISISFNLKHRQRIDNNTTGHNMSYDFMDEGDL